METLMIECIQNSQRQFMHRNAIFLCERLCAEFPSELNSQLLATCYLHTNQAYCAYHILKGTQLAQSRYLFAISCFQMDLLSEAETALCPSSETSSEVPNGAAGHYLLGLIYRYTDRRKNAVDHFKQALSIDPFLWAAYEELCAAEEASGVFGESAALSTQHQHLHYGSDSHHPQTASEDHTGLSARTLGSEDVNSKHLKHIHGNSLRDIPSSHHGTAVVVGASCQLLNGGSSTTSLYSTPSPMVPQVSGRLFPDSGPRRSTRLAAEAAATSNSLQVGGNGNSHSSAKYPGGVTSSRLSSASFRSVTVRKGQSWATESLDEGKRPEAFDDSRSDTTATTSSASPSGDDRYFEGEKMSMLIGGITTNGSRIRNGVSELLSLLRTLGEGYRLSCLYRCQDALDTYSKLSHKQYNTGWVLSQVGKAYFELVDYLEADHAFILARCASPYSLDGMDIYSTVLYHLKEEMKLSYLAQELISTDRLAPQSWYVALEDYENGIKCYQSALRVDTRHYNAWYGLGMVHLRQEKFEFAEHHFRRAFQINQRSSVIMCYLGTALHALKRSDEALEMMEKAIAADRKNPLPMYQKASILASLERYAEALKQLEDLKEFSPHESSVYALIGRIYKRCNMHDKAMLHFGLALDLKPSAADVASIKSAIEKLHVPDDLEEDS
ncbi:hypothetical protein IFM89_039248 [Coptis chinensis]|uniref:Uncharacterized protein n=1 Tax=Coptis chinensis TaxID=261450 RepID=A0A835IHD2_9MAGN|nr:hypothetical protein IFM89_039248 [Coptis chinensis]